MIIDIAVQLDVFDTDRWRPRTAQSGGWKIYGVFGVRVAKEDVAAVLFVSGLAKARFYPGV